MSDLKEEIIAIREWIDRYRYTGREISNHATLGMFARIIDVIERVADETQKTPEAGSYESGNPV